MAQKIDMEKVRTAVEVYGFTTPFYEYQTDIPKPNLNELVKHSLLIRGGNKRKGYIWTEGVTALLSEASQRESRTRALRDTFLTPPEPGRGRAFGTRKIPSMPDSDGNSTDTNSIDER